MTNVTKLEPTGLTGLRHSYGIKRDYPAISLYVNTIYVCTTTWAKNLTEAKHVLKARLENPYDTLARAFRGKIENDPALKAIYGDELEITAQYVNKE